MLLEAQHRGWKISYFELHDLRISNGQARGSARSLSVKDNNNQWFNIGGGSGDIGAEVSHITKILEYEN